MADQNITELPVKTSSGITSSDYMLGIDSAEGYQMLIRDLGDYIIRNVQVNTIAGANQTLKSALDTLNSKTDTTNLGGATTLEDFNAKLTTLANTMQTYQTLKVRIVANAGNLQPFQYATYYGTLTKNSAVSFFADLSCGLDEIQGEYANNAWRWVKQPTRSEVDALNSNIESFRIIRADYIEISFTDGLGTYDMRGKLPAGTTRCNSPIVQISGTAVQATPCVRACDMASDKYTLKVALTATYTGTVGCFVMFWAN